MKHKIALLMTCHNRRETTLNCLKNLIAQNVAFDVFLVDDGSTDGTSKIVKKHFPQVHVIQGDGTLYWNRGMLLAWKTAIEHKVLYDLYFWVNDDTLLYKDALAKLIIYSAKLQHQHILCAAIQDPLSGDFTYGGKDESHNPVIPNGTLQKVHYMNGNLVLVPKYVVNGIGLLDKAFRHHLGDYDYGLRAKKMNLEAYTTPEYLGSCSRNEALLTRGRKPNTTLLNRFKFLYSPLGVDPRAHLTYQLRHEGWGPAFKTLIFSHLSNLMPNRMRELYVKKVKKDSSV